MSLNPTPTPTRRRTLGAVVAGAAIGTVLAVAVPAAASAHVTVTPDVAAAGGYSVLTFAFSHGCDGSPTTSLTIDIPEGVDSLAPQVEPGWSIDAVGADSGIATQVVFTADEPVDSRYRATVSLQVKFSEDAAGETLAFPVLQSCAEGETNWAEIPADGQDPHDLDAPAPVVAVSAATEDAHGHGSATTDGASTEQEHGEDHTVDAAPASASTPVAPIALGIGGLALGGAALAVALVALGRTRKS